ncbi:MAG: glucose 1-dehydrogenase [Alicyclobacillus sp.]|nr:glucose 1-dehydrogenase [Alicyclobacillus sp.]
MANGRLAGKVALLTGTATGIGAACTTLFAHEGATVVAMDRNEAGAEVVQRLVDEGFQATFVHGDLTREADCIRAVQQTIEMHGRIDILLHNAGTFSNQLVHESSNDEFDRVFNLNVRSAVWMSKYTIPAMLKQGKGAICFTASKTGLVAQYNSPLYCASKGAVVQLMRAIALDYAKQGIRANAICPGIIDTPMLDLAISMEADPEAARKLNETAQPIGRLGTPEECAHAALWLCSDDASFITGVALPVDGGFMAM